MSPQISIRPIREQDYAQWRFLWDDYNAFYGRAGDTALPEQITASTWARFLDLDEPVYAAVAEMDGQIVGLVHYLFHRSTTRLKDVCYLQDLFTEPSLRGKGVGRQLIQWVSAAARAAGSERLYWQTHDSNQAGRLLYDKVASHSGFIVYSQQL